jgi:hypothetical protein
MSKSKTLNLGTTAPSAESLVMCVMYLCNSTNYYLPQDAPSHNSSAYDESGVRDKTNPRSVPNPTNFVIDKPRSSCTHYALLHYRL